MPAAEYPSCELVHSAGPGVDADAGVYLGDVRLQDREVREQRQRSIMNLLEIEIKAFHAKQQALIFRTEVLPRQGRKRVSIQYAEIHLEGTAGEGFKSMCISVEMLSAMKLGPRDCISKIAAL